MTSRAGFESEYPFESHFHELEGGRYHYLDEGSGDVLLFVHGNPTWSFAWRNLVKDLSADHRCIAVDHIGCGFSDKPQQYAYTLDQHAKNLQSLVEALDLRSVTLVAHDWGGAIGMGTATRIPDRFARFVLMNTAAFRSQQMPKRIALARIPGFGALAVRGFNAFARAAVSMAVENKKQMTPAVRAGYLAPYGNWADRIATLRFVEDVPLSEKHPTYQTLKEIEQGLVQLRERPWLFPWGMKDWCFTPAFLEEFKNFFPDAETFPLPEAGHYLFEDAPELLIGRIREFLAAHPLQAVSTASES